jgi:hypothetical protein
MDEEQIFNFYFWAFLGTCAVLILVYALTLTRVLLRKTYSKIVMLIILLLFSNIAYIIVPLGQNKRLANNENYWTLAASVCWPIGDFLFCEAHWLFAFYYMKIAKNIPRIIQIDNSVRQRDSHQDEIVTTESTIVDEPKHYRFVYWLGVIANAIFPLAEEVFNNATVYYVEK